MPHGLSKSRYIQFKACPKGLWLSIYKPEDAVVDDSTKARFSVGHQVGELAKGLLGPFVDMTVEGPDGHPLYNQMIEKTKFALKDGAENICEAAFNFAGNYCAVDILHRLYVIVLPAVNISSAFKRYIVFFVQYQRLGIIHLRF